MRSTCVVQLPAFHVPHARPVVVTNRDHDDSMEECILVTNRDHDSMEEECILATNGDHDSIEECICYEDYRQSSSHPIRELLSHRSEECQDFGLAIREQVPSPETCLATFPKVLSHQISTAATIEWNHHHVPLSPRSEEWQDFGGAIRIQLPSLEARFNGVMKLISHKISAAVNELKEHRVLLSPRSEEWQDFGGAIRIQLPSLEARLVKVMKLVSHKISASVNELKQHRVVLSPRSEDWQDFGGAIRKQLPLLEARFVEITRFSLLKIFGRPVRMLRNMERVCEVSKTDWKEFLVAIRAGVPQSALALKDKFDEGVQPKLEAVPMRSIRMARKMCKEGGARYRLCSVFLLTSERKPVKPCLASI
jgi:hypothetical protein